MKVQSLITLVAILVAAVLGSAQYVGTDVKGTYVHNTRLTYTKLKLQHNHKFKIYNSSHAAGAGIWFEYGTWEIVDNEIVLHIQYTKSGRGEKKVSANEEIRFYLADEVLCKVEDNKHTKLCYKKV